MQQNKQIIDQIMLELFALESQMVEIDGSQVKPSQCYHFESNPPHILFNTNCPDHLQQKLNSILAKFVSETENKNG